MKFTEGLIYQITGKDLKDFAMELIAKASEIAATPTKHEDEYDTRQAAATFLKVSLPTIHNLIKRGALDVRKVGRRTLVNMSKLRADVLSGQLGKYKRLG